MLCSMRSVFVSLALLMLATGAAQDGEVRNPGPSTIGFITLGVLQGGGSLVGADFEGVIARRFGVQGGIGIFGFGGGLNVHLGPDGRSSFISLQYWHQGWERNYTQSLAGPNFVYRSRKWFTCQLGLGSAIDKGPAWPKDTEQPGIQLMYAIGAYFPW